MLGLRFRAVQTHNLNFRSGMLQSWNQFCYGGGHLNALITLPGVGDTTGFGQASGIWEILDDPAMLHAIRDGIWPYSYDKVCDAEI